jgi:tRNA G10  N-methylase Trm11
MLNLPQNPKWDIARVSHSTLVNADCFDVFPFIEDKSIDAIICDLPYGTTQNKWDSILPLDELWGQYKRILKPNGAIILTGSEPFTSVLITSNLKDFKYNWIWKKSKATGFFDAKKRPLNDYETISVFYSKPPTYK